MLPGREGSARGAQRRADGGPRRRVGGTPRPDLQSNNNYLNLLRSFVESAEEGAMATYAIWNNKGGVGKSYLTFQLACEYARTHPSERVLAVDLCPQANSSVMLLGGMDAGERSLDALSSRTPRKSISGYVEDRITSPMSIQTADPDIWFGSAASTTMCPRISTSCRGMSSSKCKRHVYSPRRTLVHRTHGASFTLGSAI